MTLRCAATSSWSPGSISIPFTFSGLVIVLVYREVYCRATLVAWARAGEDAIPGSMADRAAVWFLTGIGALPAMA